MANNFGAAGGCIAVYNFESIAAGGNIVASASSENSTNYAYKACDYGLDYWQSTAAGVAPCWLSYSWGTGNEKVVGKYGIQCLEAVRAPQAWTLEGYNGSSWYTLDSQTGQTGWAFLETRTFTIANTTAYEAYRLSVTANNGGTYTTILNFYLYSRDGNYYVLNGVSSNTTAYGSCANSKSSDNTLRVYGTTIPVTSADAKEGSASLDLEQGSLQHGWCPDNKLSSGFPLKGGTTNYSISTTQWVKAESDANVMTIWAKDRANYNTGHQLQLYQDDIYFYMHFADNSYSLSKTTGITAGQWYFIATTYDNSMGQARLYIWDDSAASVVHNATADWSAHGNPVMEYGDWLVGFVTGQAGPLGHNYDGLIDELTVWNRALSLEEITDIKNGVFGPAWEGNFVTNAALSCAGLSVISCAPWYGRAMFPLTERLTWSTDILRGRSKLEQRMARREIPLQFVTVPYVLADAGEAAQFANIVHGWKDRKWPAPLWGEATSHAATLTAGDKTISLTTAYAQYHAGGLVMVWQRNQAEVVEIDTVSAGSLSLSVGLVNTYTGDKWILPCKQGWLVDTIERRRLGNGGSIVTMELAVADIEACSGHTADDTYDSIELWESSADLLTAEWDEQTETQALQLATRPGRVQMVDDADYHLATQPHGWVCRTKAQVWALRQRLHALYGRQKSFLVPTYQRDLTASRALGSGATSLYVVNRKHVIMGVNTLRTYIGLRPPGGSLVVRKVTGISAVSASEELITLNAAPGVAVPTSSLICWVDRCRLADDEVELIWRKRGVATCLTRVARISQ